VKLKTQSVSFCFRENELRSLIRDDYPIRITLPNK